jgi:hypothetical protein
MDLSWRISPARPLRRSPIALFLSLDNLGMRGCFVGWKGVNYLIQNGGVIQDEEFLKFLSRLVLNFQCKQLKIAVSVETSKNFL